MMDIFLVIKVWIFKWWISVTDLLMTEASIQSCNKTLFNFYDRDLISSPLTTHILRLNSIHQYFKHVWFQRKKKSTFERKKYFPGNRLIKNKWQVFETAQLFRKSEFAEKKGICTQRAGSILKIHEKLKKKITYDVLRNHVIKSISRRIMQLCSWVLITHGSAKSVGIFSILF